MSLFKETMQQLEALVLGLAAQPDNQIPCCVSGTGDLVVNYQDSGFVYGFELTRPWLRFAVEFDELKSLTVGNTAKRVTGTIDFSVLIPSGQGRSKAAELVDFLSEFQATTVNEIRLRELRGSGEFSVPDWDIKLFKLSFVRTAATS